MSAPIGAEGTYSIQTDDRGSSIHIHISEPAGVKAENLSLSTWGASFVLANRLHKIKLPSVESQNGIPDQTSPVLELGAGTGLVGLSAAAIWKTGVILTDLPPIVPRLAANIGLNTSLLAEAGGSACCGSLNWTNPTTIETFGGSKPKALHPVPCNKPSFILAADSIYAEDHPTLVSNTILTWLAKRPNSRGIFCYPLRIAYIDPIRTFWNLMEAGGLECIDEGREDGGEEWNEVANTPYEWCVWRWKA